MSDYQKDNLQTPYSTWHGGEAKSGDSVTVHTPQGPKDGYMVGNSVVVKNP
jgi:hypothetical protein